MYILIYTHIIYNEKGAFPLKEEPLSKEPEDLDEESLFLVAQTFKAISDPTRIRILNLLCQKEFSVNELSEKLHLKQSTVSHQLRFLKNLRLVKFRREGTTIIYSQDDDHVMQILQQTIDHATHN